MNARDDTGEGTRVRAEDQPPGRATWRLDLAYEGTAYRGWARQPGHRTVAVSYTHLTLPTIYSV